MYKRSNQGWLKHFDFILLDALALQVAFVISYVIRHGFKNPYLSMSYRTLGITLIIVDILIAAIFNTMHNVLKRRLYHELVQTVKQVLLVFLITTMYIFSLQIVDTYSRITVYFTAGFHLVFGLGLRQLWKQVVKRQVNNRLKASTVLVADEKQIPEIISRLRPSDDITYTGLVLINRDGTGEEINGISVVASLENAADFICREWVDEVFIYPSHLSDLESGSTLYNGIEELIDDVYSAHPNMNDESGNRRKDSQISQLIEMCRQMSVPVHIRIPVTNIGGKSFVEKVGGYNVLTVTSNYASPLQLAIKRTFDILGGIVGSVIALVVMLVFAPAIKKASPGPILFKQVRIGKNGKKFTLYKLRTMHPDAEERKKEFMANNRVSDGMMFKLDWDPRIIGNRVENGEYKTGIGEMLRRGSWDEWPQFFNVLLGQMSLVGTRPPTADEWEKYRYHHRARLSMKPGITGLWQVSGRSKITDFEEVVKLDTEYINNWGVVLDMKILAKTFKVVFKKDGAM